MNNWIASPGKRASMRALGVAVPGHVTAEGHVLYAGNLKGWGNLPLRALLEKRYRVPVFVERDANCGALGEKWCGVAREMESFVFLGTRKEWLAARLVIALLSIGGVSPRPAVCRAQPLRRRQN